MIQCKLGKNAAADFKDIPELIETLQNEGYTDWGWQNGWTADDYESARIENIDAEIESFDYGRNNTDHLTVNHTQKIFYRCDSSD